MKQSFQGHGRATLIPWATTMGLSLIHSYPDCLLPFQVGPCVEQAQDALGVWMTSCPGPDAATPRGPFADGRPWACALDS